MLELDQKLQLGGVAAYRLPISQSDFEVVVMVGLRHERHVATRPCTFL